MSNITPQQLVGKRGISYLDELGTIIAAEYVMDYNKLKEYDSGWMSRETIEEMKDSRGMEEIDILVAFEDAEGYIDVYTFEYGGIDLAQALD